MTERISGRSFDLVDISQDNNQSMFEDVKGTDLMKMLHAQDDKGGNTSYDLDALLASDDDEEEKRRLEVNSHTDPQIPPREPIPINK